MDHRKPKIVYFVNSYTATNAPWLRYSSKEVLKHDPLDQKMGCGKEATRRPWDPHPKQYATPFG